MKKYRLTDEKIIVGCRTLYRIQALRDFGDVKEGEFGGWIESEKNLSHEGSMGLWQCAGLWQRVGLWRCAGLWRC